MGNIGANTTYTGAEAEKTAKPDAAEKANHSTQSAKRVTRNAVTLGTREERLEILQQAAANYQKAGGKILVKYFAEIDGMLLVLPETGECASCGAWFSGNGDGCPRCAKLL